MSRSGSGASGGNGGIPTADPSALGSGPGRTAGSAAPKVGERTGGVDDLTIKDADDPTLGLTATGDVGPGDWAADTGPTQTAESRDGVADFDPARIESTLEPETAEPKPVAKKPRARKRK